MRLISIFVIFLSIVSNSFASIEDFDCAGTEYLVSVFEDGVDEVLYVIRDDPEDFILQTIEGWQCIPNPIDFEENGRLDGLACAYSDNKTPVTEGDFIRAGQTFQKNIAELSDCFEGDVINEAPLRYANESRGESYLLMLDRVIESARRVDGTLLNDAKITVEYGYARLKPNEPIWWSIEVRPAIDEDKQREPSENSCEFARDGECDEPGLCTRGTDTADCKRQKRSRSPLFCCDTYGNKYCRIERNPGPEGAPCGCAGIPGYGQMCR